MDPDPEGQKTCGSDGSGSGTLIKINFSDLSFVKSGIGRTDFTIRAGHLSTVGWSAGKVISI
jgi:hypothetical protein